MYMSEIWALRKAQHDLHERTEMRIFRLNVVLRSIKEVSRYEIRALVGRIVSVILIDARWRWLGHVVRECERERER